MWWPFSPAYPQRRPDEVDSHSYDYVIVGGGTAGCVLASRLSEDPNISVLLLERGPANDTWMSRIPIVSSNILKSDGGASSWECEPMKYCDDRRSLFFCGEVLGGGSRVNSMVYSRGSPADFNAWAAMGHQKWSYEKVLPYFVKAETSLNQPKSAYRGASGPWITQTFPYASWLFKVYQVFTDVAEAMGFARISDVNAPDSPAEGLATFDSTVNASNQRVSTFDAFLPRTTVLKRQSNLTICTQTLVTRIGFSPKQGIPQAEEVFFKRVDPAQDKTFSAKVRKEVIVCSGAVGSPQVLMLRYIILNPCVVHAPQSLKREGLRVYSGIGPREHLEQQGVEIVHDLPGVGSQLTDHIGIPVAWEIPLNESLAAVATSPVIRGGQEFIKYLTFGTGILSMPIQTLSLFTRSTALSADGTSLASEAPKNPKDSSEYHPQNDIPDIEIMPLATSAMDNLAEHRALFSKIGVFSLLATLLQPKSRGSVRLADSDPHTRPKVDFGILSASEDYEVARTAVRLSLKLGQNIKESGFPLGRNLVFPEEAQQKDAENGNTEEMDKFIRRRIRTCFHYSSSCRMAPEKGEITGVVDDELRVHGVIGLRVCDASVFPQIISSHLQAPVVMVAERCADWIKEGLKASFE